MKSYNVYLKECETFDQYSDIVNVLKTKNFLTKASKNLPLSRQMLGYKIYLSGFRTYSWMKHETIIDERYIVVYQDSDMDMISGLAKILDTNQFESIGIHPALEVNYLGPFIEDYNLHAFFLRSNKDRGESSGYLQSHLKNYIEIIQLPSECDPHDIAEKHHFDYESRGVISFGENNFLEKALLPDAEGIKTTASTYEVPELPIAQRLYNNFRLNLESKGPIKALLEIHEDLTTFVNDRFYSFL